MRKISSVCIAMFLVFCVTGMVSAGEKSNDAALRALYENKERFEMLSGAAQALLERKFGERKEIATDEPAAKAMVPQSPDAVILNVLVNNPAADATAQDTQSETTITLAGPNIVASFNDSGSYNGANTHFTGWGYSTDGGATFTDGGALPNDPGGEGDAGDPVLARNNSTGRLYLTTLGFNTGLVLQSFRSDTNGASWMVPVSLGNTGPGDFQDKEWITVDNFAGTGQGNVYVAWRSFGDGIYFVRSTDNGATFSAPAQLAPEGAFNVQGAYVAVAPDHSVHVFWLDQSAGAGTAHISKTKKSTDGGVTFSAAVNIRTFTGTATNGGLGLGGGFRTNGFPHAAINPVSGHIYVVYADDVAGADRGDVFLSRSTDNGATWSSQNVTDLFDSGTNDDFSATVAVTPDGNRLMVAWYDRELDPANSLIDYFGAIADTSGGGLTFGPQFRITSQSFPVVIGQDPVINTVYMGDYDQVVADNSFFYLTWGDNRLGNAFHTNQPDTRFAKIPVTGPGAILTASTVTVDDSSGNNNGDVEFNECVGLSVALKNSGTSVATAVTGTLSTSTPGVTVTVPSSNYPDINPGGTQTNSTPFQFQTSPSFVCGTPIDFQLQVNTSSNEPSGGASFTLSFSIPTGGVGTPTAFSNNTPTPIADNATTNIPITVSGITGAIGKVTLSMYATHTWDGDLDISLIAPDATIVPLTSDNGGNGDNMGTACS
ncbi:MAG TPA: hypothetical protein VLH08_21310, partial [Acidobacteriota bacterium]|nr:hypothetical protein [Acidobacteriota bacterium]